MVATPELNPGGDGRRLVIEADGGDSVALPGGADILKAAFHHLGNDLLIETTQGQDIVVKDYFAHETLPDLLIGGRAQLDGALIERLAGPSNGLDNGLGGGLRLAENNVTQNDATPQLAQAGEAIGTVETVAGTVTVQRADGTTATLAGGDPVFLNDVVMTDGEGAVGIVFVDGTTFSLSAGARMTMDEMVFDPASGGGNFVTSVLQGTFVFSTGSIAPNGNMEVNTPVGTIGIRGTTVAARIALEGSDTVIMLLADADGHVGRVIIQNAGGIQEINQENAAVTVTSFFIAPGQPVILTGDQVLQYFDEVLQQLRQIEGTGPADEQGGAAEDGDASDQAALENFDPDQITTAAGGEEPGEPADLEPVDQLSELLGFVPDPLQAVSFISINLFGNITTAGVTFGNANPQPGSISLDYLDPSTGTPTTTPDSGPSYIFFTGGTGNDTLDASEAGGPAYITGSAGDDTITGSANDDQVFAGGGDDVIVGGHGGGNDFYDGGDDDDTLVYASTDEGVIVNLTNGTAFGDKDIGVDTLANIENVTGGSGNDALIGDGKNNTLSGADGADQLSGLGGDDYLDGGESGHYVGGAGNDGAWQEDVDIAIFTGNLADYLIEVGEDGYIEVTDLREGGDGHDTLYDIELLRFKDQDVLADDLYNNPPATPQDADDAADAVAENAENGTEVGITGFSADPDGDEITYSLSDDAGGRFTINAVTGVVTVANGSLLNFEAAASHQITIVATDSKGESTSQSFTIGVDDVDEGVGQVTDADEGANTVAENAVGGTIVHVTGKAVDGDGDNVTYELLDDAGGRFVIDSSTGIVTVAEGAYIDFEDVENPPSFDIVIKASSGGGDNVSIETFTIQVTDVNEAPGEIDDIDNANEGYNFVTENAGNGATVAITASAVDPDAGDSITYSLANSFDGLFQIDPVSGIVTIANSALLDYETTNSYDLTVIATDQDGLSSSREFHLEVHNVDEAPSEPVDTDAAANTVLEGAGGNAYTGIDVDATDPEGSSVSYLIVNNQEGEDGNRFWIDGDGKIYTQFGFNFPAQASYQVTVQAVSGDLSSTKTFTINVTDVNQSPTEIIDTDEAPNMVAANALVGAEVNLTALALDPDANETFTYSLVSDAGGTFTIDPATGVVTVANNAALADAVGGDLFITIQVVDSGGNIYQQGYSIAVTEASNEQGQVIREGTHLIVGQDGFGRLDIVDDTTESNNSTILGQETGGDGTIRVSGPDAQLNVSPQGIVVGDSGKGHLIVEDGGEVLAEGAEGGENNLLIIGRNAGSEGRVDVTGVAHIFDGGQPTDFPSEIILSGNNNTLIAGMDGKGELHVSDGAHVAALNLEIAHGTGTGDVTISGEGTSLSLSSDNGKNTAAPGLGGFLRIGRLDGSDGSLNILDGATVSLRPGDDDSTAIPGMTIAEQLGSKGSLLVDGAQSLLSIVGNPATISDTGTPDDFLQGPWLTIGQMGEAHAIVSDGGEISISGNEAYLGIGGGDFDNPDTVYDEELPLSTLMITSGGKVTVTETLTGGDVTNQAGVYIGDMASGNGMVTVSGEGSSLEVFGTGSALVVGNMGAGLLFVTDGAKVGALQLKVGSDDNSVGVVNIAGAGSEIALNNDYGLYAPNGQDYAGYAVIGRDDGAIGTLSITDGGALKITQGLTKNTNTIEPWLDIGRFVGSQGLVTVDGATSRIEIGNESSIGSGMAIGREGDGEMLLTGGAKVIVTGDGATVAVGAGWTSDDGDEIANGLLSIQGGAEFKLLNNGQESLGGIYIGAGEYSSGTVLVGGEGSKLTVDSIDGIYVGDEGDGTLVVSDKGVVDIETSMGGTSLRIGNFEGSNGEVTISGTGSAINVHGEDNYTSIAHHLGSTGTMTVEEGGLFTGLDLRIGRGGDGTMTIIGAGSKATISNAYGHYSDDQATPDDDESKEGSFVRVGQEAGSHGLLSVLAGGVLLITNDSETGGPGLQIGRYAGSAGEVEVSGSGSAINIIENANNANLNWGAYLEIGLAGSGSMTIEDKGQVNITGDDAYVALGTNLGGYGVLQITGADSALNLSGDNARMEIGAYHGQGNSVANVSVSNGAVLHVNSTGNDSSYDIFVHAGSLFQIDDATVDGSMQLDGGTLLIRQGSAVISGNLGLAVAGFSPGTFISTVSIDVSGMEALEHGLLNVGGIFSMDHGAFEFNFNGYLPQDGAQFTFLQAGTPQAPGVVNIADANIALIAKGVSENFDFQINKTGSSVAFEALSDSENDDYIVAKGGNQNDYFDGDDGFYLNASGGAGNDDLLAGNRIGAGHHTLYGGVGEDTATGGNGTDHFYFAETGDGFQGLNGQSGGPSDRIFGFQSGTDKIVFSAAYDGAGGWAAGHNFQAGVDFLTVSGTYTGTGAAGALYANGSPVLIMDETGTLYYDDNGSAEGYTIVAKVEGGAPVAASDITVTA